MQDVALHVTMGARPHRKLKQTKRGMNRHNLPIAFRYQSRKGNVSDRTMILYSVRLRSKGIVGFEGYDSSMKKLMR